MALGFVFFTTLPPKRFFAEEVFLTTFLLTGFLRAFLAFVLADFLAGFLDAFLTVFFTAFFAGFFAGFPPLLRVGFEGFFAITLQFSLNISRNFWF